MTTTPSTPTLTPVDATAPTPYFTIWSLPACQQCDATKRFLDKRQVPYLAMDLAEHPAQADKFRSEGLQQAPIVETPYETWSGFRPDALTAAIADAKGETADPTKPLREAI